MKISHTILLAGVFVIVAEIIIFQANLQYSDTVDESPVIEDNVKKTTTLYIFIGIIFFIFGGIMNFIEKRSERKTRKHNNKKNSVLLHLVS